MPRTGRELAWVLMMRAQRGQPIANDMLIFGDNNYMADKLMIEDGLSYSAPLCWLTPKGYVYFIELLFVE